MRLSHQTRSLNLAPFSDSLTQLLAGGVSVHQTDSAGRSVLLAAVHWGMPEDVITSILDLGPDVNAADHDGRTALLLECARPEGPRAALVRRLVAAGVDVNHADDRRRTALHYLLALPAPFCFPCTVRGFEVLRLLLGQGAETNLVDALGNVPLALAWEATLNFLKGSRASPWVAGMFSKCMEGYVLPLLGTGATMERLGGLELDLLDVAVMVLESLSHLRPLNSVFALTCVFPGCDKLDHMLQSVVAMVQRMVNDGGARRGHVFRRIHELRTVHGSSVQHIPLFEMLLAIDGASIAPMEDTARFLAELTAVSRWLS